MYCDDGLALILQARLAGSGPQVQIQSTAVMSIKLYGHIDLCPLLSGCRIRAEYLLRGLQNLQKYLLYLYGFQLPILDKGMRLLVESFQ